MDNDSKKTTEKFVYVYADQHLSFWEAEFKAENMKKIHLVSEEMCSKTGEDLKQAIEKELNKDHVGFVYSKTYVHFVCTPEEMLNKLKALANKVADRGFTSDKKALRELNQAIQTIDPNAEKIEVVQKTTTSSSSMDTETRDKMIGVGVAAFVVGFIFGCCCASGD